VVLLGTVLVPTFGKPDNLRNVALAASFIGIIAAGMTFVIISGGIDLSVGSTYALATILSASLAQHGSFVAVAGALLACGFVGLVQGVIVSFLRLPPFIVTLGSLTAVRGVARLMGGDTTVFNSDLPFAFIGDGSVLGIPWLVIIAFLVVLASWIILRRTVLGTRIYAVGGNTDAARLSGISVWQILLFVYAMSGLLAGLSGIMSAARLFAANGSQLGVFYELDAIAAVILGGTSFVGGIGSIWGTLIGALIIAILTNGLILVGISDIWQYIIKGLVIICAVALDRYRLRHGGRT